MSFFELLALVIIGAAVGFSALVVLAAWATRRSVASLVTICAVVWLPLTAALAYAWFVVVDYQAAQTHARNVGIPVAAIMLWFAAAFPGLLIGLLMILAWKYLRDRRA